MSDTCTATTKAGTPCRARPMAGASTCFLHGPDAQAARARGGRAKGKHQAGTEPTAEAPGAQWAPDLPTGPKIVKSMDQAAKALAAGTMSATAVSSLAALGRLALATLARDQAAQIAALAAKVEAQQPHVIGRRR